MISRIKDWTRRMVWKVACWLAATQGVNLNRAIYVGPRAATIDWNAPPEDYTIIGSRYALLCYADKISTVFGEAP
jgi:hypothetical protein